MFWLTNVAPHFIGATSLGLGALALPAASLVFAQLEPANSPLARLVVVRDSSFLLQFASERERQRVQSANRVSKRRPPVFRFVRFGRRRRDDGNASRLARDRFYEPRLHTFDHPKASIRAARNVARRFDERRRRRRREAEAPLFRRAFGFALACKRHFARRCAHAQFVAATRRPRRDRRRELGVCTYALCDGSRRR